MKSFAALFAGRDDICGRYVLPPNVKPDARGKRKGAAATRREVVTEASYKKHLAGKERIGIVPIRPGDNSVSWFALDADLYKSPTLFRDLAKKINALQLPLVLSQSKSGGAHMWCFFRDPIPAVMARDIAKDYIKKLRLDPKTEIFPKQDSIQVEDDGNWINLPYFGKEAPGMDETGTRELTLKEFLSRANDMAVTLEDLKIKKRETNIAVLEDGDGAPPCVETMMTEGIEEGGRNSALTQIGVYLIKSDPDAWEDKLIDANERHCHPPLSMDELKVIIKSLQKKDYAYLCNQQPMCSLCDKDTCLTRKFGVGSGENARTSGVVVIENLEKIEGDEPSYRVTMMGGQQFTIPNAEALINFRIFKQQAFKRLNRMLPHCTQKMWEAYVGDLILTAPVIDPPPDTVLAERIRTELKKWIIRAAARDKDVVIGGQPYYDETQKCVYFNGGDFLEMCDRQYKCSRTQVWMSLRDRGGVEEDLEINGETHKVWRYPVPDEKWIEKRGKM